MVDWNAFELRDKQINTSGNKNQWDKNKPQQLWSHEKYAPFSRHNGVAHVK